MTEFTRSQYLPVPQDYWTIGKNPILFCIVDQIKQDSELVEEYSDQVILVNGITEALRIGQISWPFWAVFLMSKEKWIQKMRIDPNCYLHDAIFSQYFIKILLSKIQCHGIRY